MTKGDCDLETVDSFYSPMYGERVQRARRTVCLNERTYTKIDGMMLRAGERLEPPPCTCPPMLEPWEMI